MDFTADGAGTILLTPTIADILKDIMTGITAAGITEIIITIVTTEIIPIRMDIVLLQEEALPASIGQKFPLLIAVRLLLPAQRERPKPMTI